MSEIKILIANLEKWKVGIIYNLKLYYRLKVILIFSNYKFNEGKKETFKAQSNTEKFENIIEKWIIK